MGLWALVIGSHLVISGLHIRCTTSAVCINLKHLPYLEHFGPYLFVVTVTSFEHSSQVIPGSSRLDLQHTIEYS